MRGQVCYEADVNQLREKVGNWEETLERGFSFIADTNDEYDVKNLFEKNPSFRNDKSGLRYITAYKRPETDFRLNILLKTISMLNIYSSINTYKLTSPQTLCLPSCMARVTSC